MVSSDEPIYPCPLCDSTDVELPTLKERVAIFVEHVIEPNRHLEHSLKLFLDDRTEELFAYQQQPRSTASMRTAGCRACGARLLFVLDKQDPEDLLATFSLRPAT